MSHVVPNFGPFLLIRRISIGGMAEVFKARLVRPSGELGPVCAIKRLLPSSAEDGDLVKSFHSEAALASQLDHPRICRVESFGEVAGSYYLKMEFVPGHDLRAFQKLLEKGEGPQGARRMEPLAVAAIAYQTAEGLGYAHAFVDERGEYLSIVHRDISPPNLVIGRDGGLKIVDFGIAKFKGKQLNTRAGIVKGKHAYMSPEQVLREPLDRRSDLFSLGIIMYELLTGERLFKGETFHATLEAVTRAEVPPLAEVRPEVPEALADIVMACLDRDRHRRPANARAIADAMTPILSKAPGSPEEILARTYFDFFGDDAPDADEESEIDRWRKSFVSAEMRGEETTDQKEVSDATEVWLREAP